MLFFWLFCVFIIGAAIGSFLNVCIYRLPLEKSVVWPGSRCGSCYKPIRWKDNIPLVSYWLLGGRCRDCGARFSVQYFVIELATGLVFAGLFYLEVVENIHGFPALAGPAVALGDIPWQGWVIFGHHALLFSLLLVAAVCDLQDREIPLEITMTGTLLGLIGAVLWPWPWPYTPAEALRFVPPGIPWWMLAPGRVVDGLYSWPVWGPVPDWLPPGSWQLGLATGLAGALLGTFMLRWVRWLFSKGLGMEALGLGDADLMMMAGAFLGWQAVVVAFFVGVFPALPLGIYQRLRSGENALAFGPSLALGIMITAVFWSWIGPPFQVLFFWDRLLLVIAVASSVVMVATAFFMRLLRRLGSREAS
jgi:leader peptidase (prepilin peptidase)/N-methyltransferase